MLAERGQIPAIIIVTVSVAGVILLALNAALLYCFVRHRRSTGLDSLSQGGSPVPWPLAPLTPPPVDLLTPSTTVLLGSLALEPLKKKRKKYVKFYQLFVLS